MKILTFSGSTVTPRNCFYPHHLYFYRPDPLLAPDKMVDCEVVGEWWLMVFILFDGDFSSEGEVDGAGGAVDFSNKLKLWQVLDALFIYINKYGRFKSGSHPDILLIDGVI